LISDANPHASSGANSIEIVAIGASLGGLRALRTLLGALPADLGCSVVIAQHRRADPDGRLCELLGTHCCLPVLEPEDKTPIEPNHVYVAPSDYHMLVDRDLLALSVDPPVLFSRPSIDVLFESVADAYGEHAVGVVLTNSSEDCAAGAAAIKSAGGRVYVEDPTSAESPVGPLAVLGRTAVDGVMPVEGLASVVAELCQACGPTTGGGYVGRRGKPGTRTRPSGAF
jgi:two-component system chemotaxis response regulator CheB